MVTGAEEIAAARAAVQVVQIAHKNGWGDRIRDSFKHKHHVLVLGSSGTGKSNLLESLKTLIPQAIDHMDRTEHGRTERLKLDSEPFVFHDTPGQLAHAPRRRAQILEALKHPPLGIINVTCWGYHEGRSGRGEALDDQYHPREDWLERNRLLELKAMEEWIDIVGEHRTKPQWVMTLVSKSDLWRGDRERVIRYYGEGEYGQRLEHVSVDGHSVFEYCSVIHRYFKDGYVSGEFDDDARIHLRERFITQLLLAAVKRAGR
ncbi:GTPase domain-containing protein [Frankia sp. CiP3]|uniref:GTPase domain-containing protein n=1 Tax=Frankia sp. CiP3 TaxID=2880971 RepID=UPI001EF6F32D|nr:GTPase domain-containing protein [Frankia sp. CiP3]